jgi:cbb3-type cytochrome oxidase subunit 3
MWWVVAAVLIVLLVLWFALRSHEEDWNRCQRGEG